MQVAAVAPKAVFKVSALPVFAAAANLVIAAIYLLLNLMEV